LIAIKHQSVRLIVMPSLYYFGRLMQEVNLRVSKVLKVPRVSRA